MCSSFSRLLSRGARGVCAVFLPSDPTFPACEVNAPIIHLRKAAPEDVDSLHRVYIASRVQCVDCAPLARSDDEIEEWIRTTLIPRGTVTVAEIESKVAGFISTSNDGSCRWVDHLYVTPELLGKGVGSRLLAQALATLKKPIRLYTFQDNLAARDFYARHGFVALDYGDGSHNEEGCPDVLLEYRQAKENVNE